MTHPSSASHGVEDVYRSVISDVITNLRETFLDENVDVDILQQLKKEWEDKVTKSGAVNIDTNKNLPPPAMRQPPSKPPAQQHAPQHQQQHAANPQPIAPAPSAFVQPSTSNTLPQQSALHSTAHLPSSSSAFVIQGQPQQQQLPTAMGIGQATLPIQPQQVICPGPGGFYLQQANQFPLQQTLLLNPQTGLSQHLTPQQQQQLFFAAAASGQPQALLQQLDPKSKKEVAQLDGGPGMTDSSSSEEDEEEDDSIKQFIGMQEQGAEEGDGVEEDPLNSNDDQSDEEDLETLFDSENVVVCQFEKVNRARSKWKFILKDGIMHLNGSDYCFQKATGEAEW
ncbi:hypothetical protein M3Y99_01442700 [Aphelenchoides fujianensis]|nr:hypothetical protein M3Y99_01442700 [Aphelenchoides fujianensis]